MTNHLRLMAVALLVCVSSGAHAQSMFKCKQADGAYSYQSDPCPQSSTQQVLQADGRGTIKAVPVPARTTDRNAASAPPPFKPAGGEAENVNVNANANANANAKSVIAPASTSSESSTSRQAQAPRVADVQSSAPVAQAAKTGPGKTVLAAIAIIGLGLCLAVWIWYNVTNGRISDAFGGFIDGLLDIALGTRSDDVDMGYANRPSPVVLWGTLALGIALILIALVLGL